jgi:hypothetical protein
LTLAEMGAIPAFFAELRFMAHQRAAPPGYVAAFAPNVVVERQVPIVRPRGTPLTADRVRAIEAEWRQRIRAESVR